MILKRFPKERRRRVLSWTAVTIASATAVVARTIGAPAAEPPPSAAVPEPEPPQIEVTTTTLAAVPEMPEDGLVVLRYTPAVAPEPEVRRIVVSQPAGGGGAATPAPPPTTKQSSGS